MRKPTYWIDLAYRNGFYMKVTTKRTIIAELIADGWTEADAKEYAKGI